MSVTEPRTVPETLVAVFQQMMAYGDVDAVPALERGRLVGIVTRPVLIAALLRASFQGSGCETFASLRPAQVVYLLN